jgi:hypothetical protein
VGKPFKGIVNVDIKDSVPDWEPYTQPIAPEGSRPEQRRPGAARRRRRNDARDLQ